MEYMPAAYHHVQQPVPHVRRPLREVRTLTATPARDFLPAPPDDIDLLTLLHSLLTPPLPVLLLGPAPPDSSAVLSAPYDTGGYCLRGVRPRTRL